jgi:hypothetical protein
VQSIAIQFGGGPNTIINNHGRITGEIAIEDTNNTNADSQSAGVDRVLDFNLGEGDRVMLDPGTTYTVSQVGADTVIDMGTPGNQMILVGVQMSTLTAGWILDG